jgi:hypothetical protein
MPSELTGFIARESLVMLLGMSRDPESVSPAELSQVPFHGLVGICSCCDVSKYRPSSQRINRFPGRDGGYWSGVWFISFLLGMWTRLCCCSATAIGLDTGSSECHYASQSSAEAPLHGRDAWCCWRKMRYRYGVRRTDCGRKKMMRLGNNGQRWSTNLGRCERLSHTCLV